MPSQTGWLAISLGDITGIGAERLVKLHVRGPGIARSLVTIVNRTGFDPAPVNRAAALTIRLAERFARAGQPEFV